MIPIDMGGAFLHRGTTGTWLLKPYFIIVPIILCIYTYFLDKT